MSGSSSSTRDAPTAASLRAQAVALQRAGQLTEAEATLRRLIAGEPGDAGLHANLGAVLRRQGRTAEASDALRQALALGPPRPAILRELAAALAAGDRADEAEAALRQALDLTPDSAETLGALARLVRPRDPAAAEDLLRRAIRLKPDLAAAHHDLGLLLLDHGSADESARFLRRACELRPDSAEAFSNLGHALGRALRIAAARHAFERAIALKPDLFEAHLNLGHALSKLGQIEAAEAALRRAVALRPSDVMTHSALLFLLTHKPGPSEALFAEHLAWAERHAPPAAIDPRPHANDRDPERRLRIGHVSPDFREHAVAHFTAPLFATHDRSRVEIVCYSQVARPDATTQRLRGLSDEWHSLAGVPDDDAAAMIREHRIDILVDLAGHTGNHRLTLFARKPAPIQVTRLGYPGTTGMAAMDYAIGDVDVAPPALDRFYTEKIVRLGVSNACYAPPAPVVRQERPPALDRGFVTFGSFSRFTKINETVVRVWAEILRRVPGARLFLKSVYLGEAEANAYVSDCFAAHGIAASRLRLEGMSPPDAYLARFREMDIGLDPFPYNGGTTTFDTLAMGVPLIVLKGDRRAGLSSTSRLRALGLGDLVAASEGDYVDKAAALAGDLDELWRLRRLVGERFDGSTLADPVPFTRGLEAAYRTMWRRWCAGLPPESFEVPAA